MTPRFRCDPGGRYTPFYLKCRACGPFFPLCIEFFLWSTMTMVDNGPLWTINGRLWNVNVVIRSFRFLIFPLHFVTELFKAITATNFF